MMKRHHFRLAGCTASEPGEAIVEIEELGTRRRVARAIKGFGVWLGAAVVCVFIPIAHFVLVPACLIGSFFTLARRLGQRLFVVHARGRCPDCGAEQDLDLKGAWTGRTEFTCRGCSRGLHLILNEALPAPL